MGLYETKINMRDLARFNFKGIYDDSINSAKLGLDMTKKGIKREDKDFAVVWCHEYGKGRVLYNGLGHPNEVWDRPDMQKMMVESVKWVMKMVDGDATPRPRPAR